MEVSYLGQCVDLLLGVGHRCDRAALEIDLFLEGHRLLVYLGDASVSARDDQFAEEAINLVDAAFEDLVNGPASLVSGLLNEDL